MTAKVQPLRPLSPAQSAAAKAEEARQEAREAASDALSWLTEGMSRLTDVLAVCGPETLGVGRYERMRRLALHVEGELRQIESLENKRP